VSFISRISPETRVNLVQVMKYLNAAAHTAPVSAFTINIAYIKLYGYSLKGIESFEMKQPWWSIIHDIFSSIVKSRKSSDFRQPYSTWLYLKDEVFHLANPSYADVWSRVTELLKANDPANSVAKAGNKLKFREYLNDLYVAEYFHSLKEFLLGLSFETFLSTIPCLDLDQHGKFIGYTSQSTSNSWKIALAKATNDRRGSGEYPKVPGKCDNMTFSILFSLKRTNYMFLKEFFWII
jgi:hypothetical protein